MNRFSCPPSPTCRCNCGQHCPEKPCPLPYGECILVHWKEDCDHKWDGPVHEFENGASVTCSICCTTAMAHDMRVGP
jgi:hypothetical protein